MTKLLENNGEEFKKWSEENEQDKTFLLIYSILNAMRNEQRQLLSHIVSEFSHVNTSNIQHQANNKEYISSLCGESVEECIDKVCLMLPLLAPDNTDTANVFTKLVFHFILNLQNHQVPKVSSLISFMQHKNVFKSEDVTHLKSCLQQWLKKDQNKIFSSIQTEATNDENFIEDKNGETENEISKKVTSESDSVETITITKQPQNTTIKNSNTTTQPLNIRSNGDSSVTDETTSTTHSGKAPITRHPILKRTLSIIPGSTHITNNDPCSDAQESKPPVNFSLFSLSDQVPPSSSSNTTIATTSALETQSSNTNIESSISSNKQQPQQLQDQQNTCEQLQLFNKPPFPHDLPPPSHPPLLHPPISPQSSNTSTCSNDSIHLEQNDPSMMDINQWLKSLRLHKYVAIFHKLTYHQMIQLNDQFLENQGVTKGARRKMLIEIERLSERPSILLTIGQRIRQGDNMKQCLSDLKSLIFAPIHSLCPLCINNNNNNNINNSNKNKENKDTVDVNNNIVKSNNDDNNTDKDNSNNNNNDNNNNNNSVGEDVHDIPHIVTQLFSDLTDRLLSGPYEPATINTSLQLFHRCISHPSFSEKQQNQLRSFSAKLLSIGLYGKGPSRPKLSYTQSLLPNSNRMRQPIGPRHSAPIHNTHHKLKTSLSNCYNSEHLRRDNSFKRSHKADKDSDLYNMKNSQLFYNQSINSSNLDNNVIINNNNNNNNNNNSNNSLIIQKFLQTVPREQLCVLLQQTPSQLLQPATTFMQQTIQHTTQPHIQQHATQQHIKIHKTPQHTTQPQRQHVEDQFCDLRQKVLQHQHLKKQHSSITLCNYQQQNNINQLCTSYLNNNLQQTNYHVYNIDNDNHLMNYNMANNSINNTPVMILPYDQLKTPISRTQSAPDYTATKGVNLNVAQQVKSNDTATLHHNINTSIQSTTTTTSQTSTRQPTKSKVPTSLTSNIKSSNNPSLHDNTSSSTNQSVNNPSSNRNTTISTNKNSNSQTNQSNPPIITLNSPNEALHANLFSLCLNMTEHALSNND